MVHLCFSPHKVTDVSLKPIQGAMQQATSSVLYNVAFLNQIKSGPTKRAFDDIMKRPIFSYGVSDKAGGLQIHKPDGSTALVDFAFLAKKAPEPFKREWSGQKGINVHQVPGDRFQPADRQGVHRLLQLCARWRSE